MNRLDQLTEKVRDMARCGKMLTLAVIDRDGASWRACAHLWDGKAGHGVTVEETLHASETAAVGHIHDAARMYPGSQGAPIIILDV